MNKQEFINFVVMNHWTKRQLFSKFINLVVSDWAKRYKAKSKRIRYILTGL